MLERSSTISVSYTHLDVYKRQGYKSPEDFETIDELCHTLRLPAGEQGKCARYTIEAAQHGQPEDFYAKLMS